MTLIELMITGFMVLAGDIFAILLRILHASFGVAVSGTIGFLATVLLLAIGIVGPKKRPSFGRLRVHCAIGLFIGLSAGFGTKAGFGTTAIQTWIGSHQRSPR